MKKKNLLQRSIIIAIVTLVGLYVVIGPRHRPTRHDFTPSGIKETLAANIHLGLDLKGGSHLVMRVKTDEFLKTLTETSALAVQSAAKDAGFPPKDVKTVTSPGNYQINFEATDASKLKEIQDAVKKVGLADWSVSTSGNTITWTLTPTSKGTTLRMEQSGFRQDQEQFYQGAKAGWGNFFAKLEEVLAREA